jgi:uncharacterized lipoprotein YmbA
MMWPTRTPPAPKAAGWRGFAALGPVAILAACAHSPPTRFYTLDAAPPAGGAAASVYAGPPVRVLAVRLPPTMDRQELVSRQGGARLGVDDFAHWAAPVGELAVTALTGDLAARLPQGRVIFPGAVRLGASRDLTVSVLDFQVAGGQATLDASWSLSKASGAPTSAPAGTPPPSAPAGAPIGGTLRLTTPTTGEDSAASAQALAALLAQLADHIADNLDSGA